MSRFTSCEITPALLLAVQVYVPPLLRARTSNVRIPLVERTCKSRDQVTRGVGSPSAKHDREWVEPSTALTSTNGGTNVGGTKERKPRPRFYTNTIKHIQGWGGSKDHMLRVANVQKQASKHTVLKVKWQLQYLSTVSISC